MGIFDWLKQRRQWEPYRPMMNKNNQSVPPASQTRQMRQVRKLLIRGAVNVVVHRGDEPHLKVDCESPEDLQKIITRFRENTLVVETPETHLSVTSNNGKGSSSIAIHGAHNDGIVKGGKLEPIITTIGITVVNITLPVIREVISEGASNIRLNDLMQADFSLASSGSSNIVAQGNVRYLDIDVTGSGEVNASALMADFGNISLCGSGVIAAYIRQSLIARVAGDGDIVIAGNPSQRDTRKEGSGAVRFR